MSKNVNEFENSHVKCFLKIVTFAKKCDIITDKWRVDYRKMANQIMLPANGGSIRGMRMKMRKLIGRLTSIIAAGVIFTLSFCTDVKAQLLSVDNPAAVQYYCMLPANVIASLDRNNCVIIVSSEALANRWCEDGGNPAELSRVAGITSVSCYDDGTVIKQEIFVANGQEESILHEVGHFLESYNNRYEYWTNNTAWQNIYCVESAGAESIGITYKPTASEYFAECFSKYITDPGALAQACPNSFQYIQAVVMQQ